MFQFLATTYAQGLFYETETNLANIALAARSIIVKYEALAIARGFFFSLFSTEFTSVFGALYLVYNLTFHGTHFERIPVCFFIGVIFYSLISRFYYYFAFLHAFLPIHKVFNLWKIVSAVVAVIFFVFYGMLKPFTLGFIVWMVYDIIDDFIETNLLEYLGVNIFTIYFTRFVCFLAFIGTFYAFYRYYRYFKGTYEIFFCGVFAVYGALVLDLCISELFNIFVTFNKYVNNIVDVGIFKTFGFNGNSTFWVLTATGAFTYQTKYINEDYLDDKKPIDEDKTKSETETADEGV